MFEAWKQFDLDTAGQWNFRSGAQWEPWFNDMTQHIYDMTQ